MGNKLFLVLNSIVDFKCSSAGKDITPGISSLLHGYTNFHPSFLRVVSNRIYDGIDIVFSFFCGVHGSSFKNCELKIILEDKSY